MALFKTIIEFQKYFNVVGTLEFDSIEPYINDAEEKYLRNYLGKELLKVLQQYSNGDAEPEQPLDDLLPYVLNPLAAFSIYLATPKLDLKLTDSGFAVVGNNGNLLPASADRVKNLRASVEQDGYDRVETLLRFLEENWTDYDAWVSSDAYTFSTRNLINNAEDFYKLIGLEQSSLQFSRMRPTMDNIEALQIEPVISKELADVVRTYLRGEDLPEGSTTEDAIKELLKPLQKSLAYLTAGEDIDPKYTLTGTGYLAEVKKLIDKDPAVYPEYAASECYDSTKTSYTNYENTTDSKTFVFGG